MWVSGSKVKKNINGQSNVSLYSSCPTIRFQGPPNSASIVSRGREFNESHGFGVPMSSNQFFLESGEQAIREKDHTL